jgi:hypothetical protein
MTAPTVELYARLAHDVGKYVARIAHNIGEGPIPATLLPLLLRDLYELVGTKPASRVLAERTEALPDCPELAGARAALAAIDALEMRVRAGEEAAIREAAALALSVERSLRALVQRIREERA